MSGTDDTKKLMTPAEVAKRLGISPITVRSWVAKGWLTSHMTPGGHGRFLWADVEQLIAQRRDITLPAALKILVVDDDAEFRAYLVDALAMLLPAATLREASDGFAAGMAMAEFHPQLVLLDYSMPGINGAAVCRMIKSNKQYSGTRVVVVTGYADAATQATLTDSCADEVLLKPTPLRVIEGMLDRLKLREPSRPS